MKLDNYPQNTVPSLGKVQQGVWRLHEAFGCGREGEVAWGGDSHVAWPAAALPSQERQRCEGWSFCGHREQVWEGSGQRIRGQRWACIQTRERRGSTGLAKQLSGLLFPPRGHLQLRILEALSTFGRYGGNCSVHQQAGKVNVGCAHSGILLGPRGGKSCHR